MSYKNNKFKISASTWNEDFELPDGSIMFQMFQIILIIFKKNHVEKTDNSSITIYVKEIWNRITFKRNIGYYVELLTAVTMKLRGSTRSKITKDKNVRNLAQCGKNVVKI